MSTNRVLLYTLSLLVIIAKFDGGFGFKQVSCASQNNKLLSLFNLLCNTTQTTSIQARDACYGCFFRAGNLPGGATQLTSLSQCATAYLNGTDYQACATNLATLVTGATATSAPTIHNCYTGYCDFVRCVRRTNAINLIDGCFTENIATRNISVKQDRVNFFTNVTSCILARTRCNAYNPISGELQNQATSAGLFGNVLSQSYYNSLQISPTGDIRIIAFPATTGTSDLFCSRYSGLEQSTYGSSIC